MESPKLILKKETSCITEGLGSGEIRCAESARRHSPSEELERRQRAWGWTRRSALRDRTRQSEGRPLPGGAVGFVGAALGEREQATELIPGPAARTSEPDSLEQSLVGGPALGPGPRTLGLERPGSAAEFWDHAKAARGTTEPGTTRSRIWQHAGGPGRRAQRRPPSKACSLTAARTATCPRAPARAGVPVASATCTCSSAGASVLRPPGAQSADADAGLPCLPPPLPGRPPPSPRP